MSPFSPSPASSALSFGEAQKVLAGFNGSDIIPPLSPEQRDLIRRSLQVLSQETDYCIFGICADSLDIAIKSLNQYANALGYILPDNPDFRGTLEGSGVYVKCNIQSGLFYASPYDNNYRGVLLSYQSPDHPDLLPLYGHFALDLFE